MTDTAIRMKDELLKLGSQDRAALAHFLIDTLDDEDEDGVDEAWHDELVQRNSHIEAGTANGITAQQVFQSLREKFS